MKVKDSFSEDSCYKKCIEKKKKEMYRKSSRKKENVTRCKYGFT